MNPWLVWSGDWRLPTYPVGLAVGLTLGVFVLRREARRRGLDERAVLDVALVALIAGPIGARLGHFALEVDHILTDPSLLLSWDGGVVFYTGLALAVALGLPVARWRGLDPAVTLDLFAPATALGLVGGRMGCLGSGCCHGRPATWPIPVPWGITYTTRGQLDEALLGVPLHPTPIYEALLGLGLFVALSRRFPRDGQAAAWFALVYGVGRSTIEVFRGDTARGLWFGGWLSTSQVIGLASAAAAAGWLAFHRHPVDEAANPQ